MSFMLDKFYIACKNYDISSIDFILSNETFSTSGVYNNPFVIACSAGNLETVKYLFEKFKQNDIDKWHSYGFRWACSSGNLDLVKYLIIIKPDIDITSNGDVAYRWACESNKLDVVKWFCEINPRKYTYEIITDSTSKIKGFVKSKNVE